MSGPIFYNNFLLYMRQKYRKLHKEKISFIVFNGIDTIDTHKLILTKNMNYIFIAKFWQKHFVTS